MNTVNISLLDKDGEVQYGLNWGQRDGRDPNQAYLQLSSDIYKGNFFPPKGVFFIVETDDNKTLIFTRAQKEYGCALQTPENNAIIGKYLRDRLGVEVGKEITKDDISSFGKSVISFYKIDDLHYKMYFTGGSPTLTPYSYINSDSRQIIFYGAPGTGKSHKIKKELEAREVPRENVFRTTFHPDSDYSTFVGAYKPTKDKKPMYGLFGERTVRLNDGGDLSEDIITYKFVPQAFLQAYIRSYQTAENVYLVIEEINRGNCAQIFGDLFQLLDRDSTGKSEYTINADTDLGNFLIEKLGEERLQQLGLIKYPNGDNEPVVELCLPANLYIYATMNTSDQSLFPIDSAFKRRWDWEYEPIKYKNTDWIIDIDGILFAWTDFQKEVNGRIKDIDGSEDKMLGDFFVNPADGIITKSMLVNKILFYLWNDVCKDGEGDIFYTSDNQPLTFSQLFGDESTANLLSMMEHLNIPEIEMSDVNDENAADKSGNKLQRFTINGGTQTYSRPEAAQQVIRDYAQQHPSMTVGEMIDFWNAIAERNDFVVAQWTPSPNDNQSYADKRRFKITWGDNTAWVKNGWTGELFETFAANVKSQLSIDIKKASNT